MDHFFGWFCVVVAFLVFLKIEGRKRRIKRAYKVDWKKTLAGARFASKKDLKRAKLFKRRGIRIGYDPKGRRPLYYAGAGHLLTVAPARTGKGASLLVPALLSWPHSCIVVDPKAELAAICGHYRERFGEVFVLNPFNILPTALKGLKQAFFNVMACLDPQSIGFHADCDKLADAICLEEGASHDDNHFIVSARLLISGIIAALMRHGMAAQKNLAAVRDVITGANGLPVSEFCRELMKSPDPYIRQKLARFAAHFAEESKELMSVVSTADTQTGFIGNEAIAESLSGSSFRFGDLRRRSITVFICLPLDKLAVCHKYFRILIAAALSELLSEGQKGPGVPVLLMLDEMAQIGPLKALSDALGMAAGAAGVQIWGVLQDLSQLISMFPKTWESWIQNSTTMWFAARDLKTAEYVSKLAGVTEVLSHSRTVTIDARTGEPVINDGASQATRPLLHPYEVRELGPDEMLMFVEGVPVIRAKRRVYFETPEFRGKYRANPYFGGRGKSGFWGAVFGG